MKISVFLGDLADVPAEAICTSTNPRLSLMMGTGGAIREHAGFEVLRACVKNALSAADAARCRSVAMPVFATGHARFRFNAALTAMAEALQDAKTNVEEVMIAILDADRAEDV